MPEEILRTFIAIELDEPLRLALGRVQTKFKRLAPPGSVKWVAPDGIHLTLKFLGDTPTNKMAEITTALQAACAGFAPFEVTVEGRGCFPNFRKPRVVWVAVRDKGQAIEKLQAAIEKHVAPLGWPTEERGFSPHLTLGRVAKGADAAAEAAVRQSVERTVVEQIGVQRVTAVSLIKSDLRPTGAVYTTLVSVPLGGDGVKRHCEGPQPQSNPTRCQELRSHPSGGMLSGARRRLPCAVEARRSAICRHRIPSAALRTSSSTTGQPSFDCAALRSGPLALRSGCSATHCVSPADVGGLLRGKRRPSQ